MRVIYSVFRGVLWLETIDFIGFWCIYENLLKFSVFSLKKAVFRGKIDENIFVFYQYICYKSKRKN